MKYGYVHKDENKNTSSLLSPEGLKSAIRDFQVNKESPA